MKQVTRDPYAAVDWATFGRYKAALHVHTTESDGNGTPASMIDRHHELGFKIVSLTDHDSREPGGAIVGAGPDGHGYPTWPWTAFGRDPAALGMLAIQGNEPSWSHHIGIYWTDLWNATDHTDGTYAANSNSVTGILGLVGDRGGAAQMAHPGRYEGTYSDQWYVDLHNAYDHLLGHEVFNRDNDHPQDKARWDRLLELAISQGTPLDNLWGWAVDDSHIETDVGYSYHVHLMSDFTEAAFRTSLESGAFWFVNDHFGAGVSTRHVRSSDPDFYSIAPLIQSTAVHDDRIIVFASQYTGIRWISDGAQVATGSTLMLDTEGLGGYVRAELDGDNGAITHTQPWYLTDAPPPVPPGWRKVQGGALSDPLTLARVEGGELIPIGTP